MEVDEWRWMRVEVDDSGDGGDSESRWVTLEMGDSGGCRYCGGGWK